MHSCSPTRERGYAMAALLVGMAVMAIMLGVALPVWRTAVQREREAELVFRGEQYANAISIFQRRTGGYPQTLDVLEKTRAIRKLYKDPITGGDFQPVFVGQMIGGAPVVPGQPGRGAAGQPGRGGGATGQAGRGGTVAPGLLTGRGQAPGARGIPTTSPFSGGGVGQTGFGTGQTGTAAAGPIIGVVSRSTGESLRLYNGRGKYNEWAFVATAATQQAGAPTGAENPGMPGRGGQPGQRGAQPGQRGGLPGQPGARPGGPARGLPFPGRGVQPPGRGATPRPQPGVQVFPGSGASPQP
jgi:type II secretory pathway pseudopilin PulG